MTAIIIGILCILLVCQILKTILKTSIINKNKIDYVLEYIVSIIIFVTMFMQEYILRNKLLVIVVLGIIYEIISLIYMYFRYYKKETITDFSIKKVTDECEVGILVLKGKKVKLINNKMYEILNKLNIKKDYVTNIIKQSIDQLDKNYCVKVEDKYYVFVVNDNEIITFDITEEYELHQKLNDQNRKIKENNKQILLSIDNIEELEREKNLLKLKNKYHDILGQNLSILQQYLNRENISQENFEEIKFMIQKMFIDIEDTEDTNTNLENLIKIHKKNGTDIVINGKLPQNKEVAKVFFEIIREATTNAIRHAGSSKVFVNIKETLEETYMIITNNGKKSNEFITENQGIKDMRRKIEKLGGMFYISTLPEFSVNISIKKFIDECDFGILVLKGKKAKLINNKMYEILNKLNIKKDYITNIIKQSIDKIDKNYCVKLENKYYVFVINDNEIITFDINNFGGVYIV